MSAVLAILLPAVCFSSDTATFTRTLPGTIWSTASLILTRRRTSEFQVNIGSAFHAHPSYIPQPSFTDTIRYLSSIYFTSESLNRVKNYSLAEDNHPTVTNAHFKEVGCVIGYREVGRWYYKALMFWTVCTFGPSKGLIGQRGSIEGKSSSECLPMSNCTGVHK